MSIQIITPPAVEPLSVNSVNTLLGLPASSSSYAQELIEAAREYVEWYTGRALINQQLLWQTHDCDTARVLLPVVPVVSIDEVYINDVLLAPEQYGLLAQAFLEWRMLFAPTGALKVLFTAGYGTQPQQLPASLALAVQRAVRLLHEGHNDSLPQDLTLRALTAPYRVLHLAPW